MVSPTRALPDTRDRHPVETHVGNIPAKLELPVAAQDHRRVLAVITYLQAQGRNQGLTG